MKQIEVNQGGMKIPKIEYDVYAKLNVKNLMKLSNPYYNDICNIDESEDGIYIIIKDRIINYVKNNEAIS